VVSEPKIENVPNNILNLDLESEFVNQSERLKYFLTNMVVVTIRLTYYNPTVYDLLERLKERVSKIKSLITFYDISDKPLMAFYKKRESKIKKKFWNFFNVYDAACLETDIYDQYIIKDIWEKKQYSIEHIIPKYFLHKKVHGIPFNLFPCHAKTNEKRDKNCFEFCNDKKNGVWKICEKKKGIIARAVTYMILNYTEYIKSEYLENINFNVLIDWLYKEPAKESEKMFSCYVYSLTKCFNPLSWMKPKEIVKLINEKFV
jgi:hypothetical protein